MPRDTLITPICVVIVSSCVFLMSRVGFGSLVHTPGFAFKGRVQGLIRGYRRVFWQGSTDHRGVPGAPGRVVTLHEEPGSVTVSW